MDSGQLEGKLIFDVVKMLIHKVVFFPPSCNVMLFRVKLQMKLCCKLWEKERLFLFFATL